MEGRAVKKVSSSEGGFTSNCKSFSYAVKSFLTDELNSSLLPLLHSNICIRLSMKKDYFAAEQLNSLVETFSIVSRKKEKKWKEKERTC